MIVEITQAELDGLRAYQEEALRLRALINSPELEDFLRGVQLEAVHQVERWGSEHDAGNTPAEFLWLISNLATRALEHHKEAERLEKRIRKETDPLGFIAEHRDHHREKARHHCITSAAALFHWFARITGKPTAFRPGVSAETSKEITR